MLVKSGSQSLAVDLMHCCIQQHIDRSRGVNYILTSAHIISDIYQLYNQVVSFQQSEYALLNAYFILLVYRMKPHPLVFTYKHSSVYRRAVAIFIQPFIWLQIIFTLTEPYRLISSVVSLVFALLFRSKHRARLYNVIINIDYIDYKN